MKAAIFSYTQQGTQLALDVRASLQDLGYTTLAFCTQDFLPMDSKLHLLEPTTIQDIFNQMDALVFVGATGIAVRSIAPFIKSKLTDPAVVCLDVGANYVISLLSGHIGGANELTKDIAAALNAQAVITTATDVQGIFAIDEWAARQGFYLSDLAAAKACSAHLLAGKTVSLKSFLPLAGELPKGIIKRSTGTIGINIAPNLEEEPFDTTLTLIPKAYVLGIGCRKNSTLSSIEELVLPKLQELGISLKAIRYITSIDVKKEEKGLVTFSEKNSIPTKFFTAYDLKLVPGKFSSSGFVKKAVGVDNVCERSAVAAFGGKLVLKKTSKKGVTMAIAQIPLQINFSKK